MKRKYETMQIEFVEFVFQDVLVTSSIADENDENWDFGSMLGGGV